MSITRAIKAALPNPLRRALAHALRHVGAPDRLKSLLAFEGDFALPLGEGSLRFRYANRWIERDLFWKGWAGYEPASVALWRLAAARARTVVDVGANSGLFSLVAKGVNPAARVLAFEPLPLFADALEGNAALNGHDIQLVRAALSDRDGRATFYVPDELAGNIYSSTLDPAHYARHQQSEARQLDVTVRRFDSVAAELGLSHVDLVKIDAEGNGLAVLEGMSATLARDTPACLLEVQDAEEGRQMTRWFDPARYAFFALADEDGPRRVSRLGEGGTLNSFACRHADAEWLRLPP